MHIARLCQKETENKHKTPHILDIILTEWMIGDFNMQQLMLQLRKCPAECEQVNEAFAMELTQLAHIPLSDDKRGCAKCVWPEALR